MITILFRRKHRNFLRLWSAQLISQFGDRIHQLALVGLVAEVSPGSTLDLAKLLSCTILPVFLVQPFAGVFVDRWDRRTTLFICDIVRGLLVLSIPFFFIGRQSMAPIYVIVFLVFCFSRFYVPAKLSIIPQLVAKEDLLPANSLMSTTGMIAFVLGCALGGFLIDHYGARDGFLIDAATYFISAVFLISMRLPAKLKAIPAHVASASRKIVGEIRRSFWEELREGTAYLWANREIRFIISIFFVVFAAAGSVYVVIITFIQKAFGSITKDLGLISVFLGAGLFVGALLYGKFGKRLLWHRTIFSCLAAAGALLVVFAVLVDAQPSLLLAGALAGALGVVLGPVFIVTNTMVHLVSDESMRGKVFSALEIIIHAAFLLAMLASSWLSHQVREFWILVAVGSIFVVIGLWGLMQKSRLKNLAMH